MLTAAKPANADLATVALREGMSKSGVFRESEGTELTRVTVRTGGTFPGPLSVPPLPVSRVLGSTGLRGNCTIRSDLSGALARKRREPAASPCWFRSGAQLAAVRAMV